MYSDSFYYLYLTDGGYDIATNGTKTYIILLLSAKH